MNSLFTSIIAATTIIAVSSVSHADCEPIGLDNPYSNDVYGVMEWNGHYYDAGWFHLRRRSVNGGDWSDFGGGISGGGAYTLADPMIVFENELIVGGAFYFAGGLTTPNVCAWDGSSFRQLGEGLNGEVLALVEWNGKIVAGGDFTHNGDGSRQLNHVAVYDLNNVKGNGAWMPLGQGLTNFPSGYGTWKIGELCVLNGELYATGRFQSSGNTTLNGVARFDEKSNQWQPLGSGIPNMSNGNVGTTITAYENEIWLSGWFQSIGGVSAPWMAIWDSSNWRPAPSGPSRHCLTLKVIQGRLHGAGPFPFTLGGTEHDVARLEDDGWVGLGSSNSNWPNDIAESVDGDAIIVGGYFNGFNGEFTGNYLRLECGDIPDDCPADATGDGYVNVSDLLAAIGDWGASNSAADVDGDGVVGVGDILMMIDAWGACE